MSYSKYQKSTYGPKGGEQQLMNLIFTAHDLHCSCPDPPSHLTFLLAKNCQPQDFTPEEKSTIKKCLGFGETTDATTEDHGIEEGELEKLFAEDIEDNEG